MVDTSKIFLDHITVLISNLLINNKNYKNTYYHSGFGGRDFVALLADTKERAQHILEEIDKTKHLIEE